MKVYINQLSKPDRLKEEEEEEVENLIAQPPLDKII